MTAQKNVQASSHIKNFTDPLNDPLMARKRHVVYCDDDSDVLSDELEEVLEDPIRPASHAKRPKVETQSWVDKYAPTQSKDICINPRKLKEVREALESMVSGKLNCRLLVLSGPSGSSKSTVIKCLAQEILESKPQSSGLVEYIDSFNEEGPLPTQFSEFLNSCRYYVGSNLAVVFVEDLPNVFHEETLFKFRKAIKEWIFASPEVTMPPLVLSLTELDSISERDQLRVYNIDNCLTVETLLGRNLLQSASYENRIQRVKFLPLAKTFLTKTINRIASAERILGVQKQNKDFFQSLYESGDIRSLINNLEFWASSARLIRSSSNRETQITLFHAIGKIIYSSSDKLDENLSAAYSSIQNVLDNYNNISLVKLGLLENYHNYNGLDFDVSVAAKITDSLSLCDSFVNVPELEEYSLLVARTELGNVEVKPLRALPMKFPRHFQLLKERNKVQMELYMYIRYIKAFSILFDDANLLDGYLVPEILNSFRYKMKHDPTKERYDRIGGKLKKLFAESTADVMENEEEAETSYGGQLRKDIDKILLQEKDEQHANEEEELSDAIEFSEEDDDFNDTLDEKFLAMTQTQRPNSATQITNDENSNDDDDDMQDDPELDFLVSQGKL